ncbi:hypothetical protein [Epilithonimonas xixisoli]|uniref:Leucine rich repeat (LRR) protein n=1 Tax=Epilithonimonas xixisoli TaxID=1476462 RepID=A0A4R8IEV2_9FLAO|nr:hypothetical protein [Epilithonimonas xixisoli]TDX83924.1 hypothetical protein B0I22_1512 [Epilithonimonas xixisoli]
MNKARFILLIFIFISGFSYAQQKFYGSLEEAFKEPLKVTRLSISDDENIVELPNSIDRFVNLEILIIAFNPKLKSLPE